MSNTVNFKLDDDLYFELLALRVRLKARGGWKGFVERIIADYEKGTIGTPERAAKHTKVAGEPKPTLLEEKPIETGKGNKGLFVMDDDVEKAHMLEKCASCGHERSEHNLNGPGCYGDGDTCECAQFAPIGASAPKT